MTATIFQQHNLNFYNVKDFGAQGDGITDDTAAIQAAITATVGGVTNGTNTIGGTIFFPPGTYLHTGLTIYSYVHLRGAGIGASILKLKNAANADSIGGYNASSLIGGSSSGGIKNFGLYDLTVDGNQSNQSGTSYGLRWYGYGFILQNIRVRNTYSDALRSDWNGGGTVSGDDQMEAMVLNCKFHDCGGIGVNWTGPHDSQFTNVVSYKTGSHAFYQGPNSGGNQYLNCHAWGMTTGVGAVGWLLESTAVCTNCEGEGADTFQVVVLSVSTTWSGGRIFSGGIASNNVGGLQMGQTASSTLKSAATSSPITLTNAITTVAPSAFLQFVVSGATGFNGTISITGTNLAGGAVSENITVTANGTYTSVNAYASTSSITVSTITGYSINVIGLGVPYSGSSFQSGGVNTAVSAATCLVDTIFSRVEGVQGAVWFANDGGKNMVRGPVVLSGSANTNITQSGSVNGSSQVYLIPTGVTSDGTAGKGGKMQISIDALKAVTIRSATSGNDYFNYNTNSSPPRSEWVNGAILRLYSDNYVTRTVEISGGTISVLQSTSAAALASSGTITTSSIGIARVAPTANVTAVILQVGTNVGQRVIVRNESAFTVTFDVSGTSHVADGATSAIPANCSREFEWSGSLWYRMA